MALLTTSSVTAIDTTAIAKGDLIRAKYTAWDSAINGVVASVTDKLIRVLYIGTGGNVTNYFVITADELEDGLWEVSWSADLTTINEEDEET